MQRYPSLALSGNRAIGRNRLKFSFRQIETDKNIEPQNKAKSARGKHTDPLHDAEVI